MKAAQWYPTLCKPRRLYSPDQNTGVGSCSLLQGVFPTQGSNPGPPHCRQILYHLSHQGSPRILKWVACPFSRGSSQPRNWTSVSFIAGRFFISWAAKEAQYDALLLSTHGIPTNTSCGRRFLGICGVVMKRLDFGVRKTMVLTHHLPLCTSLWNILSLISSLVNEDNNNI